MVLSKLYNFLFKRTSTMALTIIAGAFVYERTVDLGSDMLFENYNKGKLWKDIAHKYEKN
ncbi:cytochrome b-c1 complex subunit 9 [Chelonus insularis]|uniref:cytochrome b-c1 complex subunit 9 n=1 Tax=Chelonus insularis TaxID=460826 RepID=UPI00158F622F|nr:cytochrome b-c1 complex subunit 9 [Chelonus insularis]